MSVEFPESTAGPSYVYTMSVHQSRYQHEIAVITFRDWDISYDAVSTGSPIRFNLTDGKGNKEFKGYVHHVSSERTPSHNTTKVIAVSGSYVMKNTSQKVYKGLSADGIIEEIAKKYRFNAFTTPHPRIYPQVSQAGHSDWELMVRLAKQCGYSLRTENTEIYLQPVLEEYTTKRSEAPRFIMRDASNPSGSTLYSFKDAGISENMEYDGDVKAAIAVSGLDSVNKAPVSITQQIRAPKTKSKSKAEFFDKFATDIVAPDPSVAKFESEAAEQRASFPYRATATVLGDATVRPDMPVYLDGIGDYSGYWMVLGTEHVIEETQRNIFQYTTKLYLGTDSLGTAVKWKDGQQVSAPAVTPARTLIPGVRQTNTPPKSTIIKTAPKVGPQSNGTFSQATNRPAPKVNNRITNAPKWVAAAPTPSKISQPVVKTQAFTNRLLGKVPKTI